MSSTCYPRRYFVIILALAAAWFVAASGSLFADEPVLRFFGPTNSGYLASQTRISAPWVSDHESRPDAESPNTRQTDDRTNLLTSAEELAPPKPVNAPRDGADKQEQLPRCFVAAPMGSLTIDVSLPTGLLPQDAATQCVATTRGDSRMQGNWRPTHQRWSATCQTHRPLYFEEVNAERYGYTAAYCLQPLISGGHFFLTIPTLPYKMAIDDPRDCVYTLGHYRPGSCGPRR